MIRIAICDNDICLCSEIESIILAHGERMAQIFDIEVYFSGDELYFDLEKNIYFDIVFLDIEMGLSDGIEIGQKIRDVLKNDILQIIYMSSYTKYCMDLFKIRPTHFLVKPIDSYCIEAVLEKAVQLTNTLSQLFSYKIGGSVNRRLVKEIIYFKSLDREVEIFYVGGNAIFYGSLENIYAQLKPFDFYFPHRSFLVNYNHIVKIYYEKLILTNNQTIPISYRKRKEFRNLLSSKRISELYER